MPRKKNPEYYKYFSIRVEGRGITKEQAIHLYEQDFDYKLRWIKGVIIESTEPELVESFDETFLYFSTLKFKQTRYVEERKEPLTAAQLPPVST